MQTYLADYYKKLKTTPMDAKTSLELRGQEVAISKLYREQKEHEEARKWEQKAVVDEVENMTTLGLSNTNDEHEKNKILETYLSQITQIKDEKTAANLAAIRAHLTLSTLYWFKSSTTPQLLEHLNKAKTLIATFPSQLPAEQAYVKAIDYFNLRHLDIDDQKTEHLNVSGFSWLNGYIELKTALELGSRLPILFMDRDLKAQHDNFVLAIPSLIISLLMKQPGTANLISDHIQLCANITLNDPARAPHLSALKELTGWDPSSPQKLLSAAEKFLKLAEQDEKQNPERKRGYLLATGALLSLPVDQDIIKKSLSNYEIVSRDTLYTYHHLPAQLAVIGKIIFNQETLNYYIDILIKCYVNQNDYKLKIFNHAVLRVDNIIKLIQDYPDIFKKLINFLRAEFTKNEAARKEIIVFLVNLKNKILDPKSVCGNVLTETLIECHADNKEFDQAIQLSAQFSPKKHATILVAHATAIAQLDCKSAIKDLKEAADLVPQPDRVPILLQRAKLHYLDNNPKEAITFFQEGLGIALEAKNIELADKILQEAKETLSIHTSVVEELRASAFANPDYANAKLKEYVEAHKKTLTFSGLLNLVTPPPPYDAKNLDHINKVKEGINHWVAAFTESTPDEKTEKDEKTIKKDEVFQKANLGDWQEVVKIANKPHLPTHDLAQHASTYLEKRQAAKKSQPTNYPSANRLFSIYKFKLEAPSAPHPDQKNVIQHQNLLLQKALLSAAFCIEKGNREDLRKFLISQEAYLPQYTPDTKHLLSQLKDRLDYHATNNLKVIEALAKKECLQALACLASGNASNKNWRGAPTDTRKALSLYFIILLQLKNPKITRAYSPDMLERFRKNAMDYIDSDVAKKYSVYVAEIKRILTLKFSGDPFHFAAENLFSLEEASKRKKNRDDYFKTPIAKVLSATEDLFKAKNNGEELSVTTEVEEEEPEGTPPPVPQQLITTNPPNFLTPELVSSTTSHSEARATSAVPSVSSVPSSSLYPSAPILVESDEVKELIASIRASVPSELLQQVVVPSAGSVLSMDPVIAEPNLALVPEAATIKLPKRHPSSEESKIILLNQREESRDDERETRLIPYAFSHREMQRALMAKCLDDKKEEAAPLNTVPTSSRTVVPPVISERPSSFEGQTSEMTACKNNNLQLRHEEDSVSPFTRTASPVSNPHQLFSLAYLATAPAVSAPATPTPPGVGRKVF